MTGPGVRPDRAWDHRADHDQTGDGPDPLWVSVVAWLLLWFIILPVTLCWMLGEGCWQGLGRLRGGR